MPLQFVAHPAFSALLSDADARTQRARRRKSRTMLLLVGLFIGTLNVIGGESVPYQSNQTLTTPDDNGLINPMRFPRDLEELVPLCVTMPCETLLEPKPLSIPVVVSLKAPDTKSWAPELQFKDINNKLRTRVYLKWGTNDDITLDGPKSSVSIPRQIFRAGDWLHLRLTYDIHKEELNIKLQKTGDPKHLLAPKLRYVDDLFVVVENIGKYGYSQLNAREPTLTTKP